MDNIVRNYGLSIQNGIPIKSYFGDDADTELIYLSKYLRLLAKETNIKAKLKQDFINSLLNYDAIN